MDSALFSDLLPAAKRLEVHGPIAPPLDATGMHIVEPLRAHGMRRLRRLDLNPDDSFDAHFREFSPHTNFEMASASLLGVVRQMEEIFAAVDWDAVKALPLVPRGPDAAADPLDDIEIPEV